MQFQSSLFIVTVLVVSGTHGKLSFQDHIPVPYRRFLLDHNSTKAWATLEQFAACSLTCVPGYEKLSEVCCNSGIDAVCSNLPWDILKSSLGHCSGNSTSTIPTTASKTVWVSLEQFAACSITCVHGYEKLAEVCCKTGIKDVCSNMPWDLLKVHLGSCQGVLHSKTTNNPITFIPTTPTTTPVRIPTTTPIKTRIATQTTATNRSPYWLPWGEWNCEVQNGACFQKRFRNCSTGLDKDCIDIAGGAQYRIDLCTTASCPELFRTTTRTTPESTTPGGTCRDDPAAFGCKDMDVLAEVCKDKQAAWTICPVSCNLCDTCWDYLNCSTAGAQKLFCGREEYALQYCRQTCGKCDNKPVAVQINKCGDPMANVVVCELLQTEICICNDPDVRVLCRNYCDNKCKDHPFAGSSCTPARRIRRDEALQRLVFL